MRWLQRWTSGAAGRPANTLIRTYAKAPYQVTVTR